MMNTRSYTYQCVLEYLARMGNKLRLTTREWLSFALAKNRSVKKTIAAATIFFAGAIIMTQKLDLDTAPKLPRDSRDLESPRGWLDDIDMHRRISQPDCHKLHRKYTYVKEQDLLKWHKLPFVKYLKNPCWKDSERRLHCLPYMYLAGMAKCGTSDLFKRISRHPDFVPPTDKEPSWLSSRRFYEKLSLKNYTNEYFHPLADKLTSSDSATDRANLITGDASVNTLEGSHFWEFYGPNVNQSEPVVNNAEYIYHLNPGARILVNVRNPIERLWSEYLAFSKDENKTSEKFHAIAKEEVEMYTYCLARRSLRSCLYDVTLAKYASMDSTARLQFMTCHKRKPRDIVMLRRGIYHVYIRDFLKVFPRQQVLIQRLEDIAADGRTSLLNTYQFLGMRTLSSEKLDSIVYMGVRNSRPEKDVHVGNMLQETKDMLRQFYKPHNIELAQLLGDSRFNYDK